MGSTKKNVGMLVIGLKSAHFTLWAETPAQGQHIAMLDICCRKLYSELFTQDRVTYPLMFLTYKNQAPVGIDHNRREQTKVVPSFAGYLRPEGLELSLFRQKAD